MIIFIFLSFLALARAFGETCNLSLDSCFPIENNQLSQKFSDFSTEFKIRSISNYAKKIGAFKKKLEFRYTPGKGISIFALEKIPAQFQFLQVDQKDCLGREEFKRILRKYEIHEFEFPKPASENELYEERMRFIFLLHHILANLYTSEYFEDFVGLPEYPWCPKVTTPYDIADLLGIYEREILLTGFKTIKRYFSAFKEIVQRYVPQEKIKIIFNNTDLSFSNFVYCYAIFESRTATINTNDNKKRDTVHCPSFQYSNTLDELVESENNKGGFNSLNGKVSIRAHKDLNPGDEAFNNYGIFDNWRFFINFGYFPRRNDHNCVYISDSHVTQRLLKLLGASDCKYNISCTTIEICEWGLKLNFLS